MVSKNILIQYCDLQEEIKDLRIRKEKYEDKKASISANGNVTDSVCCGKKGKKPLRTVKISGFPRAEYDKADIKLGLAIANIASMEAELLEITEEVMEFIDSVPISRDRMVLRHLFMDGMTQQSVASKLHIDQSIVSRTVSKYIVENESCIKNIEKDDTMVI